MKSPPRLQVDARSPIPIRRQLAEQLRHFIEGGGVARDEALPSIRELAGTLGVNPNTVARVIEDLKQGGYVEARRGKGVFVAAAPPARPSPRLREGFLQEVVLRGAVLGMTADDVAVGVLSLAGIRPAAVRGVLEVLLVECSVAELDFLAQELEARLPVHVEKVLLGDLAALASRARRGGRWRAAVTSFRHLQEVEQQLQGGRSIPVIALLAVAHLETLHRLARLPAGSRVGVAAATTEAADDLQHSIADADLSNFALVGACLDQAAALGRLVRRVDVLVCSTAAAARVPRLASPAVEVIVDDRALDRRAVDQLAGVLVQHDADRLPSRPAAQKAARAASRGVAG
jgi:GntR family transcriptional regulator